MYIICCLGYAGRQKIIYKEPRTFQYRINTMEYTGWVDCRKLFEPDCGCSKHLAGIANWHQTSEEELNTHQPQSAETPKIVFQPESTDWHGDSQLYATTKVNNIQMPSESGEDNSNTARDTSDDVSDELLVSPVEPSHHHDKNGGSIFEHHQGYCLPGCYHKSLEMKALPQITRDHLAQHNEQCRASQNWQDMWTHDSQYVYNGYTLVEGLGRRIHQTYRTLSPQNIGTTNGLGKNKFRFDELKSLVENGIYAAGVFYINELDISYIAMKRAKCASIVGTMVEESKLSDFEKQKVWLESLLPRESESTSSLHQVVLRHLRKLEHCSNHYSHITGDTNNREFELPSDVQTSDLRTHLASWEPLDVHCDQYPCARELAWPDEEDRNPDTHTVFAEMVAADRILCLNTEVDGEVAWKQLPKDVVQNDVLTDAQAKIFELRRQRRPLSQAQKVARHRTILFSLAEKYQLETEKFENWMFVRRESWKKFTALCESWSPDQKPHIIEKTCLSPVEASYIPVKSLVRSETNDSHDLTFSRVWDEFLTNRPYMEKIQLSSGNLSARADVFFTTAFPEDDSIGSKFKRTLSKYKMGRRTKTEVRQKTVSSLTRAENEAKIREQLTQVTQDLLGAATNCDDSLDSFINLMEEYLRQSDLSNGSIACQERQIGDPNQIPVKLPCNNTQMRTFLKTPAKMTPYPEPQERYDRSTFDSYRSPDTRPTIPFAREAVARSLAHTSSKLQKACPCCRSPELMCVPCSNKCSEYRGRYSCGTIRTSFSNSLYAPALYQAYTWTTLTPEQSIRRREKLSQYFMKRYKNGKRKYAADLDKYRGWAQSMADSWAAFQVLCRDE